MNKKEDFKGIMVSLLVLSFITGFLVGVFLSVIGVIT